MPPDETSGSRSALLRYVSYAASAGVVGWLVLVVLPQIGDLDEAGRLLITRLGGGDVALALALLALYLFTHALTITAAAPGVSLSAALLVRAVAGAVARLVPAGWAPATGLLATMLRSRGVRAEAIAHAVVVTSVWNTLTKLLLPLLGLAAVGVVGTALPGGWEIAVVAVGGIVVVMAVLGVLRREETARRIAGLVERSLATVARRRERPPPRGLVERAVDLQASTVGALRARPLRMALSYTAHHLTHVALIYVGMSVAARPGGLAVGWPEVLVAFAVGYLLTGLPISPGGLGTTDVAVVALLTTLGEEPAIASAGLLVYRTATYGLYVLALAGWPWWRRWSAGQGRVPPPR